MIFLKVNHTESNDITSFRDKPSVYTRRESEVTPWAGVDTAVSMSGRKIYDERVSFS